MHMGRRYMHRLNNNRYSFMLVTIAFVLLVLWLLGIIGVYSIGWFIHILLVVAIILFLIRIIQGKNPIA